MLRLPLFFVVAGETWGVEAQHQWSFIPDVEKKEQDDTSYG
jgi:hypothetical protein